MRNNQSKVDFRTFTDHFRGIYIYIYIYLNSTKKNRKITTCNRLDLEAHESWPLMPQESPGLLNFEMKFQVKVDRWFMSVRNLSQDARVFFQRPTKFYNKFDLWYWNGSWCHVPLKDVGSQYTQVILSHTNREKHTLNSIIYRLWQTKVHVALRNYVVLIWMHDFFFKGLV